MKLARSFFGDGATRAVERQLDLDDELFLPGTVQFDAGRRAAAHRLAAHGGASHSASRGGPLTRSAGAPLPAIAATERKKRSPQEPIPRAGFENSEPRASSDHFEQPDATLDADGRRWPTRLPVPRDSKNELENKIKELSAELSPPCLSIADLSNLRQTKGSQM